MTKKRIGPAARALWVPGCARRAECPYCEPKGALLRRTGAYAVPRSSHVHAQSTNNTTNPIPGSVYSAVILVAGVPWERSGGKQRHRRVVGRAGLSAQIQARHHRLSRLNAATTDFGLRRTMRLTCQSAHACTPDAAATEHERATLQRPWCAPPPPFPFPSCPYPPVHVNANVNAGSPCTRLHWMPTSPSSPSLRVHRRGGIDAVGECATIRVASALADAAPAPAPPALPH
ncbi:hypothetical protein B0H10DRAFT_2235625 [Mycena sp. CBHHK59/15]|nr:hypothetical protein B0H10DRAFT_2235625 [Mycena sp. CBHHK59/15]